MRGGAGVHPAALAPAAVSSDGGASILPMVLSGLALVAGLAALALRLAAPSLARRGVAPSWLYGVGGASLAAAGVLALAGSAAGVAWLQASGEELAFWLLGAGLGGLGGAALSVRVQAQA